jgi:SAM-dependent methyltransferase
MQPYLEDFYNKLQKGSRRSAKEVIPLVLDLVHPKSVIEIGCGVGCWLSVFRESGIEDIVGVDGHWVDRKKLEVPQERFLSFDLEKPFRMDREFDLVVSLEVAEHLPKECAEIFVDSLTRLGPTVLFSAAIPFQGGTNHVNEQWPEYWVRYFQERKYQAIDCIRKNIWENNNVEWWYAQNILMFIRNDCLQTYPLLKREFENTTISPLSVVHPRNYLRGMIWRDQVNLATQELATLIPPGEVFILVDEEQFGNEISAGHCAMPFLERDGKYWGPPPDDVTAIHEVERLRKSGANSIVFGWPAFWWLDYYAEMHHHLSSKYNCVLKNDRLVIFDLRR